MSGYMGDMTETSFLDQLKLGCDPSSASCVGPLPPFAPPFLGPGQTPDQVIVATADQMIADAQAQAARQSENTGWFDSLAAWVNRSPESPAQTDTSWWLVPALVLGGLLFVTSAGFGFGARR